MPKFFDDLKGKAQSALNATPLAAYVPGLDQQGATQPGSTAQTGTRSHTLGAIQHQIRTLQVQYGSSMGKDMRQLQLFITGQKGLVLDLEKQALDAKTLSKEFYVWGQSEDSDIKDVTDRLAYLQYVQGTLAANLSSSLDAARAPLKALRDAESQLQPRRNLRTGYGLQISRLKNEAKPGTEHKLKEIEALLEKAETEDEPLEREVEILKRKAIVESEAQKWQAIREYGEKLVLLSQACTSLVEVLPSIPPTKEHPYQGAASTSATRSAVQRTLDQYKPGTTTLLPVPAGTEGVALSFGETHATELSRIGSVADHHQHATSTLAASSPPRSPASAAPLDPSELNNAPAPIPSVSPGMVTSTGPPSDAVSGGSAAPTSGPTVAETGVPLVAGKEGPGPASGSLAGGRRGSQDTPASGSPPGPGYGESAPSYGGEGVQKFGLNDPGVSTQHESAEDEKKRLEREDRERLLRAENRAPPTESAEEEKKRLEREERERVLRTGGSGVSGGNPSSPLSDQDGGDGSVPPPYTEPQ